MANSGPSTEMIGHLSKLFSDTLNPAARQQAESTLTSLERQPEQHFALLLINLISSYSDQPIPVRLAASIKLKNVCRQAWSDDEQLELENNQQLSIYQLVPESDRQQLRSSLLPLLLQLSQPNALSVNPIGLRLQLSECISLIADKDFPEKWPTLIDELVTGMQGLSPDSVALQAVLQSAHSIFRKWRAAFRSDALYTEINLVLEKFAQPFLELLRVTDEALSQPSPIPSTTSTLLLLLQIFHDLSAQDLPPLFEDNLQSVFGIMLKYLNPKAQPNGIYVRNPALANIMEGDPDEATPQDGQKIRAEICSIGELYAQRYLDVTEPFVPELVKSVWEMLGGCGQGEKEDVMVSRAIAFLATIVRMPSQRATFSSDETLNAFVEAIILPNISLREQDEEMFEDEPLEWIRRDFAMETLDADTRRRAASSFSRALLDQFADQITSIISRYITQYLQKYTEDPVKNWRMKDTAVYLLTSIASTSSTAAGGVSSTNSLVNVVQFFSDNVFVDLQADTNSVHPILQVDAIKYLQTFRNQLTKGQLLSVLPLLVRHLESQSYVTSSYAAIAIERILFLKSPQSRTTPLFTPDDVQPFAEAILMALFRNIQSGSTPEKVAENDYLMRCVMRLIVTARERMVDARGPVLSHLTAILSEILKNPSNPKFSQYCFESISALIRFVTAANASTVSDFEQSLSTPFMAILQNDVSEFVPFVFQILSQMLEIRPGGEIPPSYTSLLPSLLTPALWQARSNIPALVRLLQAFLSKGSAQLDDSALQSLLGIYQQLIASRVNDEYGFELLLSIFTHVDKGRLTSYRTPVLTLMLTRLQSSRTEKFSRAFVHFVASMCCIKDNGFPDYVVDSFDGVQPGLFGQILQGVMLPDLPKALPRQKRTVVTGFSRLLVEGQRMLEQPGLTTAFPAVLSAILRMTEDASLATALSARDAQAEADEVFLQDWEEQGGAGGAGFQGSFAVLRGSITASATAKNDLASVVLQGKDIRQYLGNGLKALNAQQSQKISSILSQIPSNLLQNLQQYMA